MARLASLRSKYYSALLIPLIVAAVAWAPGVCLQQNAEDFAQFTLGLWAPTAFFPHSNRAGNLIPLLASGVRDVFWNANLILILRSFLSVLAVYYAPRLLLSKRQSASAASTQSVTLLVTLWMMIQFTPLGFVTFWVSRDTYLASLGIALPSFLYLRRATGPGQAIVGGLGLAIAFWVNLSIYALAGIYLATLVVLLAVRLRRRIRWRAASSAWSLGPIRRLVFLWILASAGFALADLSGVLYQWRFPELSSSVPSSNYLGVHFRPENIFEALHNLAVQTGGLILGLEFLVCSALVLIRLRITPFRLPKDFRPLTEPKSELALLAASAGSLLLVSQNTHTEANAVNFRYFLVSAGAVIFLASSFLYGLVRWAVAKMAPERHAVVLSLIGFGLLPAMLAATVSARYKLPSSPCSFQQLLSASAHLVTAGQYAGVVGNYWDVWPVVFGNALLGNRNAPDDEVTFPVTDRGELVSSDLRRRVRDDLMREGRARVLCLAPSPGTLDLRDCSTLLKTDNLSYKIPGLNDGTPRRSLALPTNSVEVEIRPAMLNPGQKINFGIGGNALPYQFSGWWMPESFGSWTAGSPAELFFSLAGIPGKEMALDVAIVNVIGNSVSPPVTMSAEVMVNDHHLTEWLFNPDSGNHRLHIPGDWLRVGGTNFLTFRIYSPHTPKELGSAPADLRSLGLAVASIQWLETVDSTSAATVNHRLAER